MKKNKSIFICLISIAIIGCQKEKAALSTTVCNTVISYTEDIKPIINNSCVTNLGPGTGCHDAWIFEYDGLIGTINNETFQNTVFSQKRMPIIPNQFGIDSLTQVEIKTLRCWIEQGYPEN